MQTNPIVLQSIINGEYLIDGSGKMTNENTDLTECMQFGTIQEATEYAELKGWPMLEAVEL